MPRRPAAFAVLLAALLSVPARAVAPVAVTADGRALHLGDVVARGRLTPAGCAFDPVVFEAYGVTARSVTLRADAACRLTVTALRNAPVDVVSFQQTPKVDETGTDTASTSAIGLEQPTVTAQRLLAGASTSEVMQVGLDQTVYDETGLEQYADSINAEYVRNKRTGDVSALEPTDGFCKGSTEDDVVTQILNVRTTEIHDCYYKTTINGPAHIAFVTGGFYRERYLVYERDARALTEKFDAWRDGHVAYVCLAGTLPPNWSHHCDFTLV